MDEFFNTFPYGLIPLLFIMYLGAFGVYEGIKFIGRKIKK